MPRCCGPQRECRECLGGAAGALWEMTSCQTSRNVGVAGGGSGCRALPYPSCLIPKLPLQHTQPNPLALTDAGLAMAG